MTNDYSIDFIELRVHTEIRTKSDCKYDWWRFLAFVNPIGKESILHYSPRQ